MNNKLNVCVMKPLQHAALAERARFIILLLLMQFCLGVTAGWSQCQNDTAPPVALCRPAFERDVPPGGSITLPAAELNNGSYDNCTPSNQLQLFLELGPPSATPPSTTALDLNAGQAGVLDLVLWVVDAAGNASFCTTTLTLTECTSSLVMVCNADVTVELGPNFTAEIGPFDVLEGGPYCDYTTYLVDIDLSGNPQPVLVLGPDEIGDHIVSVTNTATGNRCWGTINVLPGVLNAECPLLFVDIASIRIRPCQPGYYNVFYVNASTQAIANTSVEVTLDPALAYVSSSIPATPLGNQRYRFDTGDLNPGESGGFRVDFTTDCDVPLGATHCSEAHIFPDTLCGAASFWSGAQVEVEGECVNDTVFLRIRNTGTAPNAQSLDFIVVEDVLMRQSGSFSLGNGQTLPLDPIPSSGATYRLEAQQEPGHPYGGMPSVTLEGCGGFTPGLVTLFSTNDPDPFISVHCRENTAAYDPNDKQALPRGYGAEHFVDKSTVLDYMIRFQNTGTDTAFRVVIVDTLSGFLNAPAVRPGASSHPYTFELEGNVLRFVFDPIALPDSTANLEGSQGFVQFSIPQVPGNPDGTQIVNSAAIYFDFNAPVITNQTLHTVGTHFIQVTATHTPAGLPSLKVYPNPATDRVFFDAEFPDEQSVTFVLTDAQGRVVRTDANVRLPMQLISAGLPTGAYFFHFTGRSGRRMWSGKVMVR